MDSSANERLRVYAFGNYQLDTARASLLGPGGSILALRPKAFDVLRLLVENAHRVVSRDELMKTVWPDVTVNDDGITQCVKEARRALGEFGLNAIRTVNKRGYHFTASVAVMEVQAPHLKLRRAQNLTAQTARSRQQYDTEAVDADTPALYSIHRWSGFRLEVAGTVPCPDWKNTRAA